MSLSEKDRAVIESVMGASYREYSENDVTALSMSQIAALLQAAREEASQGAGEPVADPFAGQLAEAQADPEWLAKWAISPPPDPRTKALEEAVNKAIRILSDHKLGEPRRVLDARDVLIIARAALNQGADHGG